MSIFEKGFSHAGLYQIGEVAKCCGVDRQTILFYEKKGLLSHTVQNESSGYRYYSPEDMANLLFILRVRDTGMSLSEISDFLKNGAPAAERATKNMEKKLAALLEGLAEVRAMSVKKGDYTVSWRSLPAMCCFVREYRCNSIAEATEKVYGLFNEALKRNLGVYAFYAEYPDEYKERLNLDSFTMRACIQVRKGTGTPEFPFAIGVIIPKSAQLTTRCGLSREKTTSHQSHPCVNSTLTVVVNTKTTPIAM